MKTPRGYTLHELLIGLLGLVMVGLFFGWIYVIIHFIMKFW